MISSSRPTTRGSDPPGRNPSRPWPESRGETGITSLIKVVRSDDLEITTVVTSNETFAQKR